MSLFSEHLLPAKTLNPKIHFTNFDYGAAAILLLAFVLFVWVYTFNKKRLTQIVKAFYIGRYANQLSREEVSIGSRVSFFLSLLFIIGCTLFINQTFQYFHWFQNENSTLLSIKIAAALITMYSIKLISVKLLGYLFEFQKSTNDYTLSILLFCNTLGLFILPIGICMAFADAIPPLTLIYIGSFIIIIFIIIRLIRGIMIGVNNLRFSKLYLFLYICALEIVPFVIMAKVFMIKIK